MFTRRDVVTTGAIGAISTAALTSPLAAATTQDLSASDPRMLQAVTEIGRQLTEAARQLKEIELSLDIAHNQNTLAQGTVARIRDQFSQFTRANFKFPDYCEIGLGVFYDLYDWHVKHGQPLQVSRQQSRMTLRFMFTEMILRPEQGMDFISEPFDLTRPG